MESTLQKAVELLQQAADEARQYADEEPDQHADEMQVYVEFLQQRIDYVSTVVSALKKNKNELSEFPAEYHAAESLLCAIKIRVHKLRRAERLEERNREDANRQKSETSQTATHHSCNRPTRPPMPIPVFTEEQGEYENFRAIFDSTIDKDPDLEPRQKLAYLKKHVADHTASVIKRMPVTDENYRIALDRLEETYGGPARSVSCMYDRLRAVPRAKNNPFSLFDTYNETECVIRMLEKLGQNVTDNDLLFDEIIKKYPYTFLTQIMGDETMQLAAFRTEAGKKIQFQMRLAQKTGFKPFVNETPQIKTFFRGAQVEQNKSTPKIENPKAATSSRPSSTQAPKKPETAIKRPIICTFCSGNHWSDECKEVNILEQRKLKVADRCERCFYSKHEGIPCKRIRKCAHCGETSHNRALCPTLFKEKGATLLIHNQQADEEEDEGAFNTCCAFIQDPKSQKSLEIRLVLDPASDKTLLTDEAARKVGIFTTRQKRLVAKGLGNQPTMCITDEKVALLIYGVEAEPIMVHVHIVDSIADDLPVISVTEFLEKHPRCADYRIPDTGEGKKIDLLIGNNAMYKFLTLQTSIYVDTEHQLMSTKFGWMVIGRNKKKTDHKNNLVTLLTTTDTTIEAMWNLELIGIKNINETNLQMEEKALENFYKKIKRIDGRYEVNYPFVTTPPNLSENFGLAIGRLRSLYKKLKAQPTLLQAYDKIINDQVYQGIVEDIPANHINTSNTVHYIPHHAVISVEKSTPIRIVYDASSKTRGTLSLNENILKGTKWLGDLIASLLRFRKNKIAIISDIEKAFHQIGIAEESRDVSRYLWVKNIHEEPHDTNIRILRFKRMAFGVIASPFLLYAVIQYHLTNNPTKYTKILATDMYADNLVTSISEIQNTEEFYNSAKATFTQMGMNLAKWATNSTNLRQQFSDSDRVEQIVNMVLGLVWDTHTDTLSVKQPNVKAFAHLPPTKRIAVRTLAAVFDPLGWALPVVILVRMFIRKLWNEKLPWDKKLVEQNLQTWCELREQLNQVTRVTRPRMYAPWEIDDPEAQKQIHIFVDASKDAYGCVIYMCTIKQSHTAVELVASKARLAPKIEVTIPRLELLAALIGCRFAGFVINHLHLQKEPEITVWSDSRCVLSWLTTDKILPAAIQKLLTEIRSFPAIAWKYVPTSLNPADVITRGTTTEELVRSGWLSGPRWLIETNDWPNEEIQQPVEQNVTASVFLTVAKRLGMSTLQVQTPFAICIENFSNLQNLLRKTAYRIWALNTLLKRKIIHTQTDVDYAAAKILLLRYDQQKNYGKIEIVDKNKPAYLRNTQIFYDEFGLIRCRSRIQSPELSYDAGNPILLVRNSWLTKLIILDEHERNLHSGTSHTLASIRRTFWLPHGRRTVFYVIRNECYKCKIFEAKPYRTPNIAPLPNFRITKTWRPFTNIGVDIYGPYLVRTQPETNAPVQKRWILLFTCLTIRAVHLEILQTMDTIMILHAFRRFVAKRGSPELVVTDNAPQFHTISGAIIQLWQPVVQAPEMQKYFAEQQIKWKFIPPAAPWMGGAYERLVQTVKNALKKSYGDANMYEQQFITAISEVQAVVNNRPITYIDKNIDTPLLTPNTFLRISCPAVPLATGEEAQTKILTARDEILYFWRTMEQHLEVFWRYWSDQYVLQIRERQDIMQKQETPVKQVPKIGDVVVMIEPNQKRGQWRKALIERLIHSQDGRIRAAQIKFGKGTRMVRPINKLAPIEMTNELPILDQLEISQEQKEQLQAAPQGSPTVQQGEEIDNTDDEVDLHVRLPQTEN